ncbi:hypothetical protein SAMN02745123_00999 [Desulforamulus aeronauticus DSM 10349]|uniref:Uncharacterized protein n=1 Tax=Desulforamulus aeronauticus DSM 10349 TaxID=1121421 RepID=A0A1M6QEY9_9FIRM|nr:hypothetical protein SAMN02745123_00999 [Desulforamulus aeronauticus DSM 10349]
MDTLQYILKFLFIFMIMILVIKVCMLVANYIGELIVGTIVKILQKIRKCKWL